MIPQLMNVATLSMSNYASFRNAVIANGGTIYDEEYSLRLFFEFFDEFGAFSNGATLITGMPASKVSVLYAWDVQNQTLVSIPVARAGTKWTLRKNGNLEEWQANFPAFEWNADGTYRGVSAEPGVTNLALRSQEFNNVAWSKAATGTASVPVVTPNVAIAPDGTMTADLIVFARGAGNTIGDRSRLFQTPTVVNATAYNHAIYLKAATGADVGKQIAFRGSAGGAYGVITLTASWVRYDRTETSVSTTGNFELENRGTITADNTVSVHVWQADLILGTVPQSIIPTTGSTASRLADNINLTGASALIGQAQGYLGIGFTTRNAGTNRVLVDLWEDASNYIRIGLNTSNQLIGVVFAGGVAQASFTSSALTNNTKYGVVLSYSAGATLLSLNGAQVGTTDASATIPALSKENLGMSLASDQHANCNLTPLVQGATVLSLANANDLSTRLAS